MYRHLRNGAGPKQHLQRNSERRALWIPPSSSTVPYCGQEWNAYPSGAKLQQHILCARLQIVPKELRNILFVAFHLNPVGSHLNACRTLHCLCLQYHWPEMFSNIKHMCQAFPGCALSNSLCGTSSKLIYHSPIEAPFRVLFVNAYSAGKYSSSKGSKIYLITACGMTGFSIMEPILHANSTNFTSGNMKIQLRFGFCHTIVLDKDSKYFGVIRSSTMSVTTLILCQIVL